MLAGDYATERLLRQAYHVLAHDNVIPFDLGVQLVEAGIGVDSLARTHPLKELTHYGI